jgi:hypothetical protein
MGNRRFTRLTDGFSKKVDNHAHVPAIYYIHYNFGRIRKSLRVKPAMEAGVSDHVWTLEEIAKLADQGARHGYLERKNRGPCSGLPVDRQDR